MSLLPVGRNLLLCITFICWKPSEDLIAPSGLCQWGWSLKVSKVSILADKQAKLILMPVSFIMCLQGLPRPPCSAVHSTQRLQSQQRCLVATQQQPHSSLTECSELTAKDQWWLLGMSKTFSLTETNLKLNQDYFKINEFNHDFICEFISRNSAMISHHSS